jgi:hypothetical protein
MRRFNFTSASSKGIKSRFYGLGPNQYPQLQHSNLALPALYEGRHNLRNSIAKLLYLLPKGGDDAANVLSNDTTNSLAYGSAPRGLTCAGVLDDRPFGSQSVG